MAGESILLVDDDPDLLRLLALRLGAAGYKIECAASGEAALPLLALSRPQLLLTDLRMTGMDGMALFEHVRSQYPGLPVIILTAHGSIPDAIAATRRGVFGYLTKPFDSQALLGEIASALRLSTPQGESAADVDGTILTRNPVLQEVLTKARLVAQGDASVLIQGDSGTGKELLARVIHESSLRKGKPFVAVNCGAIPENLLESELFGHVRGAFTGAARDYKGLFQTADGGTLFLDEIGDMPTPLQVKLLRVLQERNLRPVGSAQVINVDVRIISATHRDLAEAIRTGRFREDLYYRLNVVALTLPPLARRREDIPLLANHFLSELAEKYRKAIGGFAPGAMEALVNADWPGNVRQLQNLVEQAVALSTSPLITASLVQTVLHSDQSALAPFEEARRNFERDYLVQLLKITNGNVTHAARMAKRNRTEFYKLLERHALEPGRFKPERSGEELSPNGD